MHDWVRVKLQQEYACAVRAAQTLSEHMMLRIFAKKTAILLPVSMVL